MVEVGQFCTAKCSKYLDYGIKKGDLVYIAGEMMTPLQEEDPYLYRKLFVAAFTEEGHVDSAAKPLSVDGRNFKPVSKNKQKQLYAQLEKDFAKEE